MRAHENVLKAFPRSAINGFMKGCYKTLKGIVRSSLEALTGAPRGS